MSRKWWRSAALIGLLLSATAVGGCGPDNESKPKPNTAGAGGAGEAGAGGQGEPGGEGGSGGASTATKGTAVLEALGVKTDIGNRVDPTGAEVPADYNPVLKPVTQLAKRSEVFAAGIVGQGANLSWTQPSTTGTSTSVASYHHVALDWANGARDFTPSNLLGDDSWATLPKALASGDFDGDGKDEVFVTYVTDSTTAEKKNLGYRILKRNAGGSFESVFDNVLVDAFPASYLNEAYNPNSTVDYHLWQNYFTATSADLDGNGQSEIVIAIAGTLVLLGDDSRNYSRLAAPGPYDSKDNYTLLKVAAGDLNQDGRDEVVVSQGVIKRADVFSGTATYRVFEGVAMHEVATDTVAASNKTDTATLRVANCAIGDLDADGRNEVLFAGQKSADKSAQYSLLILKPSKDPETGKISYGFTSNIGTTPGRNAALQTPMVAIADFDGDGKKDMLAYRSIFHNLKKSGGEFTTMSGVDLYKACSNTVSDLGAHNDGGLAVGDIDGDLKADVLFVTDGTYELCAQGLNSALKWVRKGTGDIADDSFKSFPAITMGDYDGDSIAVKFVGSELLFSDPHPIAVIASYPFWSGIEMDGGTSFGTGTEKSTDTESSVGFSVGVSFGYESEGLFDLWSVSLKASFESSFDWTATTSVAYAESYTYSTTNEDAVVFTTVPYDVYYYEILQAPDPEMVGTRMTVNLPRKPVTLPVERTFYNEHNGTAPDIDDTVLSHTLGDPLSYPSKADAEELIANSFGEGLISKKVMTVGEGSNSSSIELSRTTSTGSSFAFDIGVTIEAEAGAGGFTVGASAGFHYGESYGITTSDSAVYSGEVSSLPKEDYSLDKSFDWGLFTYRGKLGAEQFIVVQYYTAANL